MENSEALASVVGAENQQAQNPQPQPNVQQNQPNQTIYQQQNVTMETENDPNQPSQNEPIQNQQSPEQQEEGQVNEGQKQQQRQQPTQKNQQNTESLIDKDSYINKLQTYLAKIKTDFNEKSNQFNQLAEDNKKTKETLKKVRFDFLSSKQQISTLTQQKADLEKEVQSYQKLNQQLNDQINIFKEAGDVNVFKNKIIQLQKLLQVQKQELELKQKMIDQKEEVERSIGKGYNKIQILGLIQKYEKENEELGKKNAEIQMLNQNLQSQIKLLESDLKQAKLNLADCKTGLSVSKQTILQLEAKISQTQDDYKKKIRQSEETLSQFVNRHKISGGAEVGIQDKKQEKSPEQKYGIRVLGAVEERDLILKQFIELQVKYQTAVQELSNLRERHYHTMREIKNLSSTHINKKQYSQLYQKYAKLKKCLENSLLTEEALRKELQSRSSHALNPPEDGLQSQAHNLQSRYRSMMLEQPENALNQVEKIIQKSADSQKQFFTLRQQLQTKQRLIKAQKLLNEKQQTIIKLQKQIQSSANLIQLYENELTYKNNEIQLLRNSLLENLQKIHLLQSQTITKQQHHILVSQIEQKKLMLEILEIKNIQALKENSMLKNEKQVLTELYNNLKSMYEEMLNRQPQSQVRSQDNQQQHKQGNTIIVQTQPCKECQQRQERIKQVKFSDTQIQTQGLAQLYFKQIKSLLTILKKFPQKVDDITGKLEAEKGTIHDVKKRYEQVTEMYGAKYRQLEEQKKANEQWRAKQREEIREEFQEIRQLLMNQRLVTALKKAKSLIEYYEENAPEAEGEDNVEEGEEQANDKNDLAGQEPIEEEKQNP